MPGDHCWSIHVSVRRAAGGAATPTAGKMSQQPPQLQAPQSHTAAAAPSCGNWERLLLGRTTLNNATVQWAVAHSRPPAKPRPRPPACPASPCTAAAAGRRVPYAPMEPLLLVPVMCTPGSGTCRRGARHVCANCMLHTEVVLPYCSWKDRGSRAVWGGWGGAAQRVEKKWAACCSCLVPALALCAALRAAAAASLAQYTATAAQRHVAAANGRGGVVLTPAAACLADLLLWLPSCIQPGSYWLHEARPSPNGGCRAYRLGMVLFWECGM
jgi:hypothetical protein